MHKHSEKLYREATNLLHRLSTEHGILASTIEADNYRRVWARDSIVCSLAGILMEDPILINGLKKSLLTLAQHQHSLGMIPSNVLPQEDADVSYGSLVGRVDTNTWFIIGACLHYLTSSDEDTWNILQPAVLKCRQYLKSVEFNGKGWIYTPLSGNWADEYPVHGYTLYDNALRLWGERLWLKITKAETAELDKLERKTWVNFWPAETVDEKEVYQKSAYHLAKSFNPRHYISFILPGIYDGRFDAAGNAIALLLNTLNDKRTLLLRDFLSELKSSLGRKLVPAFWPPITKESPDWDLLKGNYSFEFKNHPGHFHNGGIWPVWMGLFCLGLSHNGLHEEVEEISNEFMELVSDSTHWDFNEFMNGTDFELAGKTQMGYTASGIVFMIKALENVSVLKKFHI